MWLVLLLQRGKSYTYDFSKQVKLMEISRKECQRKGWKDKDHRTDCKMLQNADLRNLFAFKWHKFDGPVRFPLPSSDGDRVKVVAGKVHKRALQTIPEA